MAFQKVGTMDRLAPGSMLEFELDDRQIVVCNVGGELHAIDGRCPHRGGPLGQGALHGKMVVCPWHAWEFDCTTGQNDYDPRVQQARYTVKVEGSDILVDIA